MDTYQDRFVHCETTKGQQYVLTPIDAALIRRGLERSVGRRQNCLLDTPDMLFMTQSEARDIAESDELEVKLPGESQQFGFMRHRPIFIEDFANHPSWQQSREPRQI